ncbi:MAG TPA: putative Na+/H+ antiporter [Telluria sp.]|nr:putative Na+/H+ antiporter [Telluria sp.]
MSPTPIELIAAMLFAAAIIHTFATPYFERLAHARPAHAGLWSLLGEVEAVFGFWALILFLAMLAMAGTADAVRYLDTRDFTEPLFVFAIMVIAASRPVLHAAAALLRGAARSLPFTGGAPYYVCVLALVPLLGSFITEPAAMTLAALILSDRVFAHPVSTRFKYATLGTLFVNVSIGGTLTSFAAPPVLMVAGTWGWDTGFMMNAFGWKAALAVMVNALAAAFLFRRELAALPAEPPADPGLRVPLALTAAHLAFLGGVVAAAHHPPIFVGLLLLFLGVAHAYERHQDRLILREAMLVAFFLAGLVVLGGQQKWWLEPVLTSMSEEAVFFGATLLTAFTDNAALTYLGSQVEGLSEGFKYALVAGAAAGGGLTVIANAPNPAGLAILRGHFDDGAVSPLGLLLAALPPTLVAALAFLLL